MPVISSLSSKQLTVVAPDQSKESLIRRRYFFTESGFVATQWTGQALARQSDGKILIGGNFTSFNGNTRNWLIRLNSDGREDTSFNNNLGSGFSTPFGYVAVIAIQSDGKILVGGRFDTFNGNTRVGLVRLNSDGTEDTAFYTTMVSGASADNAGFPQGAPGAIVQQTDGKILVGGAFTRFNSTTDQRKWLVRLNSDGSEDTTFYTTLITGGSGGNRSFNGPILSLALQSDGKILVGGQFLSLNVNARRRMVRLNSDGTEDTAFYTNLGTGFDSWVMKVYITSSNQIMVGGWFTTVNGTTRNYMARLNSNGSLDTSWNLEGTGFNERVVGLLEQPDGKFVAVGRFTEFNGQTKNRIVRLNTNGTLDTSFAIGNGLEGGDFTVYGDECAIDDQNRIIVSGTFTTYNSATYVGLVRLNSQGVADPSSFPSAT